MSKVTPQTELWSGDFGREYIERNNYDPPALDAVYLEHLGVTRTALNERFIGGLDRQARTLEVGANVGNQLRCLAAMGFEDLYGIEINKFALERARQDAPGINFIFGTAFDIPFKDAWFDVVFTSGVLIHIKPADLPAAMREIHRCSRHHIWGFEYWAEEMTAVNYRGNSDMLWKGDYARTYLHLFPDLALVKRELVPRTGTPHFDCMFLLEKSAPPQMP